MSFAEVFLNRRVLALALPDILSGMLVTVELAAAVVAAGLAAGTLLALLRSVGLRAVNLLLVCVVDLFRALPPLVIIVLVYFGLPSVGLAPSGFVSAWASLACVLAAFTEEIVWAGLQAVPRGQWEAARSTGLGFPATLIHVALPQALRMVVPPLVNRTIAITKNTALASVVAVPEILSQAGSQTSVNANPSPLILGAAAYLVLFLPVVLAGRWIEHRWKTHR